MFGASTGAKPGGFSFGTPAAGAAPASTGFNFGGGSTTTTAAPASAGFGFGGGTPTPAATGFGTTTATGFGTPAPTGGSSGFSFGGTATSTAAGSNFGGFSTSTPSAAPATGGGFSFGGNTVNTAPGTTGTTGFNFGAGTGGAASAATPSLFNTGTTPTSGGFGFGTGAGTTGTTSSFGAKPTGSTGFGFNTGATGATGFGFNIGAQQAPNTGFGTLGAGTGTNASATFGTAPAAVSTPAPIIMGGDAAVAQLNSIKYAYEDPMQSRFKFLMYNTVDPSQRHLYVRPAHISERLWEQAEQDNPDPLNCVPVPITGFKDLLKRIQVQQDYADKYNTFTDDLRTQLKEMEKTSRTTEEKLDKCRHEHVQLAHKLVKIMKDIEFLQNLGKPLQREEMNLAMALKKLQGLLDASGQYKARLNDAIALQRIQDATPTPPSHQLSPVDLQRIYQFMDKQRQGLEHLTNLLNDDLADIKLMKETWRR